jgi:peptide/nickel transport system permease protein
LQAYILRRILVSLPLLLVIAVSTFVFINLAPGDAIDAMIDPQELEADAKDLERLREAMGLNRSVPERFVVWLGQIVRGNLGYSYYTGEPVLKRISAKMLPTLELTATAMILSTVLGTIFGIIAALKQYSMYDYTLGIASLFGVSIPTFFFALLALYLFAFVWEIFPSHGMGYVPGEGLSLRLNIYHLILPALVLSIDTMAGKTRYARTAMLEVLKADYVTTARAKGLSEHVVVLRHGFRNALIPLITVTMLRLPGLFGGALLVEAIFTWPGMGQLTIQAVGQRDYPMIMGLTMIVSSLVLLANLAADMLYAYADPRVRVNS